MEVRTIKDSEKDETREMILEAFKVKQGDKVDEHILVDKLRLSSNYDPDFDIVAVIENQIVGHALLTIVTVNENQFLCLAPISVRIEFQKTGIGSKLIKYLEEIAIKKNYKAIFILGDPNYYGKFKYVPAAVYDIKAPFEVESRYFMVKELYKDSLLNTKGILKYAEEFGL